MKPANRKKLFLCLGLLFALIFTLLFVVLNVFVYRTAKQLSKANKEPAPLSQNAAEIEVSESQTEETENVEMQTVGTGEFGYVTVPDTWMKFTDLDGGTDFQYSNPQGTSIITLNTFSFDDLTEEQKSQVDLESAAQSVWYNLENNQVSGIEGARVTLGPYDALQIYGYFTSEDYGLESGIVCWVFESSDGVFHYVAAEAALDDLMDVVSYVEDSYTLTPPEA